MGQKLYVGGLPYSVTEEQLQELFSAHGTVESARVIADKYTGQSRGFGFVDMSSPAEAQQAIKALHGSQLSGRTLVVNEARPQEVPYLARVNQGVHSVHPLGSYC
jgi:cold-inducible RNA-binding protein